MDFNQVVQVLTRKKFTAAMDSEFMDAVSSAEKEDLYKAAKELHSIIDSSAEPTDMLFGSPLVRDLSDRLTYIEMLLEDIDGVLRGCEVPENYLPLSDEDISMLRDIGVPDSGFRAIANF